MNNDSQKCVLTPKLDIEDKWPSDVKTAAHYISTHLTCEHLSISKLKQDCKINGKSFSARFKLATGFHPKEYILFHRIEAGKKLLQNEVPVVQTGLRIGFSSHSAFCKAFKRKTGLSPSDWAATSSKMK